MRYLLLLTLLCCTVVVAIAQERAVEAPTSPPAAVQPTAAATTMLPATLPGEAPAALTVLPTPPIPPIPSATTLAVAKSLLAIRVTDPAQQIVTFTPLLSRIGPMLDEMQGSTGKANCCLRCKELISLLQEGIEEIKQKPGVNTHGDFWLLVLPHPPAANNEHPSPGTQPDSSIQLPQVVGIVSLSDPQAFKGYLAGLKPTPEKKLPHALVCGDHALLVFNSSLPDCRDIAFDLPLTLKQGIVLSFQVNNADIDALERGTPPFVSTFMAPLFAILRERKANFQRVELGLSMVGNDLQLDSYFVPVPGSTLANELTAPKVTGLPLAYAGYLPRDMAMCAASEPMLAGAPGIPHNMLVIGTALLSMFLPPDRGRAFNASLNTLIAQCTQGRAIGITSSPVSQPGDPTLVAVYHVTSGVDAKAAVRDFITELTKAREAFLVGMLSRNLKVFYHPEISLVSGIPVDKLMLIVKVPDTAPCGCPPEHKLKALPAIPAHSLTFECWLAYFPDKMLFTMGKSSKAQMAALIGRVKNERPGFAAGARGKALVASLPADVRGFEFYATSDLCRVMVNLFAEGKERDAGLKWLRLFPNHLTAINSYQEIQAGCLHGTMRIPGDELDMLFALIRLSIETCRQARPLELPVGNH